MPVHTNEANRFLPQGTHRAVLRDVSNANTVGGAKNRPVLKSIAALRSGHDAESFAQVISGKVQLAPSPDASKSRLKSRIERSPMQGKTPDDVRRTAKRVQNPTSPLRIVQLEFPPPVENDLQEPPPAQVSSYSPPIEKAPHEPSPAEASSKAPFAPHMSYRNFQGCLSPFVTAEPPGKDGPTNISFSWPHTIAYMGLENHQRAAFIVPAAMRFSV